MNLEKNFNIDIERLISRINNTKNQLDELNQSEEDRTEDVIRLETELKFLKEELDSQNNRVGEFTKNFLNELLNIYNINSKVLKIEEKNVRIKEKMKLPLISSFSIFTIFTSIYSILYRADWIGIVGIIAFIIAVTCYITEGILTEGEQEQTELDNLKTFLRLKENNQVTLKKLKTYFPNNKFLKETNLIDNNFYDFLEGFLLSEGVLNKEDENKDIKD